MPLRCLHTSMPLFGSTWLTCLTTANFLAPLWNIDVPDFRVQFIYIYIFLLLKFSYFSPVAIFIFTRFTTLFSLFNGFFFLQVFLYCLSLSLGNLWVFSLTLLSDDDRGNLFALIDVKPVLYWQREREKRAEPIFSPIRTGRHRSWSILAEFSHPVLSISIRFDGFWPLLCY